MPITSEAEQLRAGAEKLISETVEDLDGDDVIRCADLQELLDDIDACDSLAWLESPKLHLALLERQALVGVLERVLADFSPGLGPQELSIGLPGDIRDDVIDEMVESVIDDNDVASISDGMIIQHLLCKLAGY